MKSSTKCTANFMLYCYELNDSNALNHIVFSAAYRNIIPFVFESSVCGSIVSGFETMHETAALLVAGS